MSRSSLIQTSMRGGEISKAAWARHDIATYGDALAVCLNSVVRVVGPADKRAGFVDLGAAKSSAGEIAKWLVLAKSTREVVRIELCGGVMRFWDGMTRQLILSGGVPVEVAYPWADADLAGLRTWQSGDVMWIAHVSGTYPLKVLKRTAYNAFSLADFTLEQGPFLARTTGNKLTFSGVSGPGVTVTAASSVFSLAMVGKLLRCEAITFDGMQTWSFDNVWQLNDFARHANNIYKVVQRGSTNKSGDAPPIHTTGSAWDGSSERIRWEFQGYTHGLARITGYTSPTQVTVTIINRLPFYGATALESDIWQLGAIGGDTGYPRAGVIHEERLGLLGTVAEPDTIFLSSSVQYTPTSADFFPGHLGEVTDDNAVRKSLANGATNPIVWGISLDALILATEGGVHRIAPPSPDEAITPAGATPRVICSVPASDQLLPVVTPTSFIYVPFYETELIEVQRDNSVQPRDLAVLASHIVAAGVASMAYARKPSNAIWLADIEGRLASMTYSPENEVVAWARHELGGQFRGDHAVVDDVCAAPGPYRSEEVWVITRRTINGATVRRIEYQERAFDPRRMRLEDACCLDAAGYFDQWNADAAKTMTFTPDAPDSATGTLQATGHTPFLSGHVGKVIFLRDVKPTPRKGDSAWPVQLEILGFTDTDTVSVQTLGDYGGILAGVATSQWAFATKTLAGLGRLEGEVVRVNADGADYGTDLELLRADPSYVDPRYVVTSGAITLPEWVARGWIGKSYRQHLRSLPFNTGEASGAARGSLSRIDRAFIMIDGAAAGEFRKATSSEAGIALAGRDLDAFMGATPPAAEDDVWEELPGGFDRDSQIEVINDTALPCNVAGWVMRATINA